MGQKTANTDFFNDIENKRNKQDGLEIFRQSTAAKTVATHAHIHEVIECIYILNGSFTGTADEVPFSAVQGDFIVFRSNTIHSIIAGSENKNIYDIYKIHPGVLLNYSPQDTAAEHALQFMLASIPRKFIWRKDELNETIMPDLLTKMRKEAEENHYGCGLAIRSMFARLLLEVLREWNKDNTFSIQSEGLNLTESIYKVIGLIQREYAGNITALSCAESVNMSYSYFSRQFRHITGLSFKEYLNRTRLQQAERLLLTTDKSVTDVAFECGYNNLSYFIYCFRKAKGCTPYQLRQQVF